MKDMFKFAVSSLLMLVTLIMINMIFVQTLTGDYDWINVLLAIVFTLIVLAAAFYDGINRGAKDSKYTAMMEKQQRERGYVMSAAESEKLFKPVKGLYAGLIIAAPAVILSVVCMIFNADGMNWVINFLTRLCLGHFLGLFVYVEKLMPWIYLPLSFVYPAVMAVGYTFGPKLWEKQIEQMEKAKREKRRKVNRRRKKKTV